MYARHGDPESKSPKRKGCTCDMCADNGVTLDRFLLAYANDEVNQRSEDRHPTGCECDECLREKRLTDPDTVREECGCKLAGHDPTTHYWASIYQQIREGYLDPSDYDLRYLQVAQVGDEVFAHIQDDQMPDTD
jgi:hypothetical protein